jgi:phosphoacetylglucosamine mutase
VDCANGVGAIKLREFIQHIPEEILAANVINDQTTTLGALNKNVSDGRKK